MSIHYCKQTTAKQMAAPTQQNTYRQEQSNKEKQRKSGPV
jgi:hypothetical protein